jgi:outer membrane protein TolC
MKLVPPSLVASFLLILLATAMLEAQEAAARPEPLSLRRAVELALVHSATAVEAAVAEQRAFASYREARNQYLPQVIIGSGLGDSWGYPLSLEGSAPSLVNISAQSALLNPAVREFTRAAHSEYRAAAEETKQRRNQAIEDTVLAYMELVKWEKLLEPLDQQERDAQAAEQVVAQRVQAGIDSEQKTTEAKLAAARARLRVAEASGALDLLRARLSDLTGVPARQLEVEADSAPPLPGLEPEPRDGETKQVSPAVRLAEQHAVAASLRARGEHRALWPSADFASQYAVLATFNNWLQFFPRNAFQRNNATIGVVIRFPFLNPAQHARAEAAEADAIRATKAVETAKNQVSEERLRLEHSIKQLEAAEQIRQLEYELAQSNIAAIQIRMNSGTATIEDAASARLERTERLKALVDAKFELLRARIGLLRSTGELEAWVRQGK